MAEPEAKRPRLIDVAEHVKARVAQIGELLEVVDNSALVSREVTVGPRTALQRLPRHMRRRAMSYNLKRLPRSQRAFAAASVAKSKHRKKPPSRFWRRRPRNLLSNYARRQREVVWLETHIWHAKRFRMEPMWGYKIPSRSFQRNFRPTYRDSMRHAAIRDQSFLRCLEISTASRERLIELLAPLSAPGVVPSFAFKMALEGKFEVSTILYEPDQFPYNCLGPVKFMWVKRDNEHVLVVWIHPANWNQVFQSISKLLEATLDEHKDDAEVKVPQKINLRMIEQMRVKAKTYSCTDGIKMVDCRDQLARFRLFGPQSIAILSSVLTTVAHEKNDEYSIFEKANVYWNETVSSRKPAEYPDGVAFSILVEDPRLTRPPMKTLPNKKNGGRKPVSVGEIPRSPLEYFWNAERRENLLKERVSNDKLNKMRGERLAPIMTSDSKIPIVVVLRSSGTGKANSYDGAELVVPGGFGMDFWIALQFGTAHAASQHDQKSFDFEAERMSFPYDIPDCAAGTAEEKAKKTKCEAKYLKRPHNRRIKYWSRLSVKHPFEYTWPELVRSWTTEADEVDLDTYVLRDRRMLLQIQAWISGKSALPEDIQKIHGDALIQVRISAANRGCPKQFALICEPSEDDLKRFKEGKTIEEPSRSRDEAGGDVEMAEAKVENHEDEEDDDGFMLLDDSDAKKETIVSLDALFPDKVTNAKAKKKGKKVEMKRKAKERKKLQKIGLDVKTAEHCDLSKEAASLDYKNSCSRRIMGRVVRGGYSFTDAKGRGLGYCTLNSLAGIKKGNVMFRNTSSKYYHLAKLSVLTTLPSL